MQLQRYHYYISAVCLTCVSISQVDASSLCVLYTHNNCICTCARALRFFLLLINTSAPTPRTQRSRLSNVILGRCQRAIEVKENTTRVPQTHAPTREMTRTYSRTIIDLDQNTTVLHMHKPCACSSGRCVPLILKPVSVEVGFYTKRI